MITMATVVLFVLSAAMILLLVGSAYWVMSAITGKIVDVADAARLVVKQRNMPMNGLSDRTDREAEIKRVRSVFTMFWPVFLIIILIVYVPRVISNQLKDLDKALTKKE